MGKLRESQLLFTTDVGKLIAYADEIGVELTFGDAFRSQAQQLLNYFGNSVYSTGRALKLIKTKKVSWTMNSKHLERLAVDFNFFVDGKLTYSDEKLDLLGTYWESLNDLNEWGGFWKKKDAPHFQRNKGI